MPCVVIIHTYMICANEDRLIKKAKRRLTHDDEAHPSFAREINDFLNISGLKLRKKKGPDGWTSIRSHKQNPVYWKYKIAGPEDAVLDEFNRDLYRD